MADDPQKDDPDGGVVIVGPGGWRATAHGRDTILVLLVGVVIALGYLHHQSQEQRLADSSAQHTKIEDKFNEMIYVLSLPQADRERLNLSMPDSLRAKTHRRRAPVTDDP